VETAEDDWTESKEVNDYLTGSMTMGTGKLRFKLKRQPNDVSNAIILTFHGKWYLPLIQGDVTLVFRKYLPADFTPSLVYAYVCAPTSAIVARMDVLLYESLPAREVIELAEEGLHSRNELRSYAKDFSELQIMRFGATRVAKNVITQKTLTEKYQFWPASTFIPLSSKGVKTLDSLGSFQLET